MLSEGVRKIPDQRLCTLFINFTKKNYATLAFQGITAIKAKGQTIHSFFKFPPHFISPEDVDTLKDKEVIQKLDIILIDEVSMVRADLFDAIPKLDAKIG